MRSVKESTEKKQFYFVSHSAIYGRFDIRCWQHTVHSLEWMCFPREVIMFSILKSFDSISSCRQNAEGEQDKQEWINILKQIYFSV